MSRGQSGLLISLAIIVVAAGAVLFLGYPPVGLAGSTGGGASVEVLHADANGNVIGGSSFPANVWVVARGSVPPRTVNYALFRNGVYTASWAWSSTGYSYSATSSVPFKFYRLSAGSQYGANTVELRACINPLTGGSCAWSTVAQTTYNIVPLSGGSIDVLHANHITQQPIGGNAVTTTSTYNYVTGSPPKEYTYTGQSYVLVQAKVPVGTRSAQVKLNGAYWTGKTFGDPVNVETQFKVLLPVPSPAGVKTVELLGFDGTKWWPLASTTLYVFEPAKCGNRAADPGEECDDGNKLDNDGCSAKCRREYCGDGIVQSPREACDDQNLNDLDGCRNDCTRGKNIFCACTNNGDHAFVILGDGKTGQTYVRGLWPSGYGSTPQATDLVPAGQQGPGVDDDVELGEAARSWEGVPVVDSSSLYLSLLGTDGIVGNDKVRLGLATCVCREVTDAEYNDLVDFINDYPRQYRLASQSCMDFVENTMERIGMPVPNSDLTANVFGITGLTEGSYTVSDPAIFLQSLQRMAVQDTSTGAAQRVFRGTYAWEIEYEQLLANPEIGPVPVIPADWEMQVRELLGASLGDYLRDQGLNPGNLPTTLDKERMFAASQKDACGGLTRLFDSAFGDK